MDFLDELTIAFQEGRFEKNRLQKRRTLLSLILVGGIENNMAKVIMVNTEPRTYFPQTILEKCSYIVGCYK